MRWGGGPWAVACAALVCFACGGGGQPGGAQASHAPPGTPAGATTAGLARGVVAALPQGTIFLGVYDLPVPPGGSVPAPAVPGVLYAAQGGVHVSAGSAADLPQGAAAFIAPQAGLTLSNPGSAAADWYFVTVQLASARSRAPLPGATPLCASDDLPPLPQQNQAEVLQLVTLQAGGRSATYRPNGVELVIGVEGTVAVSSNTPSPTNLTARRCLFALEGTQMQVVDAGSGRASYLDFYLLPQGSAVTRPAQ